MKEGEKSQRDQYLLESVEFLGRDFAESFAQIRHYDGMMWDVTKFSFLQLLVGVAASWTIFTFATNDGSSEPSREHWPLVSAGVLLISYLFSIIAVFLLAKLRTYFVVVTRYVNDQRDHFLSQKPAEFANRSGMYTDYTKPLAFHFSSTQFILILVIAFLGSLVLASAIGILLFYADAQNWVVITFGSAAGILSALFHVVTVVRFLKKHDIRLEVVED